MKSKMNISNYAKRKIASALTITVKTYNAMKVFDGNFWINWIVFTDTNSMKEIQIRETARSSRYGCR